MKLLKFSHKGAIGEGILDGDDVCRVGDWFDGPADKAPFTLPYRSRDELDALRQASPETLALSSVTLGVPADPRAKIICVGMNYRDHTKEIKADVAENPVLFTRPLDSLVAHSQPIIRPRVSETFDFEGELALVIGRKGRHLSAEDALSFVAGYSCFLDGSVREYQRHSLTAGKNFWHSGAMGPWITTTDETGHEAVDLETRLNGETVQSASTSQMIFGIPTIIEYVSRFTLLRPGDIIATGTPGGVGSRRTPPLWMKAGDTVEVELGGIGRLQNRVEDEA